MKTRPILFSAQMVRALLDGSKTQTRRVVKPQPTVDARFCGGAYISHSKGGDVAVEAPHIHSFCPHGQRGDQLWVRETFRQWPDGVAYRADYLDQQMADDVHHPWEPSIFMPRWASRITLEITAVRVERLQDISETDAVQEGMQYNSGHIGHWSPDGKTWWITAREAYRELWKSINGPDSWSLNPWVWVIEFKVVAP